MGRVVVGPPGKQKTTYKTDKGYTTYDQKTRTHTGPGRKPKGAKVRPTSPTTSVTTSPSGTITTQGYGSQKAARRARRTARASQRRVRAVQRAVAPKPQKRSQRARTAPEPYVAPRLSKDGHRTLPVKGAPTSKPVKFEGLPTAGAPTLKELRVARQADTLKTNRERYLITPKVGKAARELKRAKRAAKRSQPSLAGLAPAEREVARYARKAHRKYPDVPTSLLMSLTRQESDFQADAVSSAGAQGLTQFIPSTAAAYGVRYGTGRKEKQSQLTGAARLLSESGFASDPKGALTSYTGGYSDAEYNDPVLQGAADYAVLDKPGSPRAARRLKRAKAKARKVGLKAAEPKPRVPKTPTIVRLGEIAQKRFGLTVGENPAFGGVEPVHTEGSFHYSGQAIDVSGDPAKLAAFNKFVATRFGDRLAEMFYDPGINIDNGVPTGPIGGHGTHVHVAIDEPGTRAYGLVATAQGLPVSGSAPFGYYGAGRSSKAARESAQRARRAALTPTEAALRKLKRLGIAPGQRTEREAESPSSGSSATLRELERKYGAAA